MYLEISITITTKYKASVLSRLLVKTVINCVVAVRTPLWYGNFEAVWGQNCPQTAVIKNDIKWSFCPLTAPSRRSHAAILAAGKLS